MPLIGFRLGLFIFHFAICIFSLFPYFQLDVSVGCRHAHNLSSSRCNLTANPMGNWNQVGLATKLGAHLYCHS